MRRSKSTLGPDHSFPVLGLCCLYMGSSLAKGAVLAYRGKKDPGFMPRTSFNKYKEQSVRATKRFDHPF